tara:strand:+ start:402 stop:518 length:117 start_codon:yes stop_codon:yes gene_type:complete
MKNFILILIIILSLFSCGKKGDPEYKATNEYQNLIAVI